MVGGVYDVEVSEADEEVDHGREEEYDGLPDELSPDYLLLALDLFLGHYLHQVLFLHVLRVIVLGLD